MKYLFAIALFSAQLLTAQELAKPFETDDARSRSIPSSLKLKTSSTLGDGMSPSTWGITSMRSGTRYGTDYYAGNVDRTRENTNFVLGTTYAYSTFTNELRIIYTFDVSSLAGRPSPVWSSFMFDIRERPNPGDKGLFACSAINLVSDGTTHSLVGNYIYVVSKVEHLDIYDAKEFENADPFAHPELAYTGVNPLLGTVTVEQGTEIALNFDVTDAVSADLVPMVPTLGEVGMAALLILLAVTGVFFVKLKSKTL